jgi:hypothetical protein
MSNTQPPLPNMPANPLTPAHLEQIKNALKVADYAQQQINLAKQAGVNVDSHQAKLNESRQQLLNVKNVYFPGQ